MTTLEELLQQDPDPASGYLTQFPAAGDATWRWGVYLADPAAGTEVEWFDITQWCVGVSLERGADQPRGRYRATIAHLTLRTNDDRFTTWNEDTSPTFGVHVKLGAGLLIRAGVFRVLDDEVTAVKWRFTNRVERWDEETDGRGEVRRYPIRTRDLMKRLVNRIVAATDEENWRDRVDNVLVDWLYGVDVYGAETHDAAAVLTLPERDEQPSAINELDTTLDPAGLVWLIQRNGRLLIRPRPGDTFHTDLFADPPTTGTPWTDPTPVVFSALAGGGVSYIPRPAGASPFGIGDDEDAVRNHIRVTDPLGVYDTDDPTSIQRHEKVTLALSWIAGNNQVADDILDSLRQASPDARPIVTDSFRPGFGDDPNLTVLDLDQLHPVTIVHRSAPGRTVVTADAIVRSVREDITPRQDRTDIRLTYTVDIDSTASDPGLNPPEDLLLVELGETFGEFTWTNPAQSTTPTHTQVRMLGVSNLWTDLPYGGTGLLWGGLEESTDYQFQVRYIVRVDGLIVAFSDATTYGFTTDDTPGPVIDDDGDTVIFPEPVCEELDWELHESDDGETWTIIDDGTISTPPWTLDLSGYTFDPTKLYRIRQDACGDTTYSTPFNGVCTDPTALGSAPFDDADLVAYWPGICPPDRIVEAVSEEEASKGPCFDLFVLDGDLNVVLVANGDGAVAFGQVPAAVAGLTGDATIAAKVLLSSQPDDPVVSFGIAGLWIDLIADGDNWAIRGRCHEAGGGITTITPGTLELDFGAWYDIALVHDVAAGDLFLYVNGGEVASALGIVGARHDYGTTGQFEIGVTDDGLITNCALWDRVLAPEELPGATPVTVTINQKSGQADPTSSSPILFTIVFSEAVTGFATGDVTLSGTAGATTATVTGSGATYEASVTGMTTVGTVIASIGAAVCTSVALGQPNQASTSTDNTVQYGPSLPTTNLFANWDASDTGTISSSSGLVDTWTAVNNGSLTATGVTTTRPTTGATTRNGHNVLDFAADLLTFSGSANDYDFFHLDEEYLIFIVCKVGTSSSPEATYGLIGDNRGSSSNAGFCVFYDDAGAVENNVQHYITRAVGGSFCANNTGANNTLPPDTWCLVEIYGHADDPTAANRSHIQVAAGSVIANNVNSGADTATDAPNVPQIGALGNATFPFTGSIAQVVIYRGSISDVDVRTYLGIKWNVTV